MTEIQGSFHEIYGLPSWYVTKGEGSFVTLEFGQPHLKIWGPRLMRTRIEGLTEKAERRLAVVRGEWQLWIYCCQWSLSHFDVQIAHGESSDHTINQALRLLNGQALTDVRIESVARTTFQFDLGCELSTWPASLDAYDGEPVDQWSFYKPDGTVVTLRGDDMVSDLPTDQEPTDRDWHSRVDELR